MTPAGPLPHTLPLYIIYNHIGVGGPPPVDPAHAPTIYAHITSNVDSTGIEPTPPTWVGAMWHYTNRIIQNTSNNQTVTCFNTTVN